MLEVCTKAANSFGIPVLSSAFPGPRLIIKRWGTVPGPKWSYHLILRLSCSMGSVGGLNNKYAVRPVDVLQMAATQSDNLLVCTSFNPNSNPIPIINPKPNLFWMSTDPQSGFYHKPIQTPWRHCFFKERKKALFGDRYFSILLVSSKCKVI